MFRLTRRNWWNEIGDADLDHKTKGILRSAVSAFLNKTIPPQATLYQYHLIIREVGLVKLGDDILIPRFVLFRFRLTELNQGIILPELEDKIFITLMSGSMCIVNIIEHTDEHLLVRLQPTNFIMVGGEEKQRTFIKDDEGRVHLDNDVMVVYSG